MYSVRRCVQSVVIRSRDEFTGAEETHVYRGPINAFKIKTCEEYCQGVNDSKKWFKDEFNITLTPLYVSCIENPKLNNENLTLVAIAGAGATDYVCKNITNCMPQIEEGYIFCTNKYGNLHTV